MLKLKNEYDIHKIIKTHPYLLGPELESLNIKHEKIYSDRTRSDFVFSNEHQSIVVEVKIGYLDTDTIEQAVHYLHMERKENPDKILIGIFIGYAIKDNIKFNLKLKQYNYPFKIKYLDVDIPTKIKICDFCRKANKLSTLKCKFCGSLKFVFDPFLFS